MSKIKIEEDISLYDKAIYIFKSKEEEKHKVPVYMIELKNLRTLYEGEIESFVISSLRRRQGNFDHI